MSNTMINSSHPYPQMLAMHTSLQDLLLAVKTLAVPVDYTGLRRSYPGVKFIGLVGFDTQRQTFVLMSVNNKEEQKPNQSQLSHREQEVLKLVATGYTNLQIARELTITENTVKTHLQNIFAKLKVRSRTEAAMYAMQQGLLAGR